MPALPPNTAPAAEVRVMEIRRQLNEAVHTPEISIPDHYTMNSQEQVIRPTAALALPTEALKTLAKALLAPAPAPKAKLLAAKRKAQEWFG